MARETLLTTAQAATDYGFSPAYVARLAQQKKIIAQKMGRDWLISRDSIARYANDWRQRKPGPKGKAQQLEDQTC